MKLNLTALVATLALVAPSSSLAQTLALDPVQIDRLGVETGRITRADASPVAVLPATVMRAQDDVAAIAAPFEGVISHIHVLPGQRVEKGDPIVTIASRDFAETLSALEQARAEAALAKQSVYHQQALVDAGLAARAALEQAQARLRAANAMVAEYQRFTSTTARSVDKTAGGYTMRAPTAGEITSVNVKTGDVAPAMSALAMLSQANALWVEVQTPARLLANVSADDEIMLEDGRTAPVISIQRMVDPQTRAGKIYAALPADARYYVGQFVEVQLLHAATAETALAAPSSAVVNIDGDDFVFKVGPDGFEPLRVELISRSDEHAIITGDLVPGDEAATRGLSELKALMLAEMN